MFKKGFARVVGDFDFEIWSFPGIWMVMLGSFYLTTSNANPFRYSVSGIMGMIG
jgi:hypothetical protein